MKTVLASLAAVAALSAVAAPAVAQPYDQGRHDRHERSDRYDRHDGHDRYDRDAWMSINQRQARIDQRIDLGVRQGDLNRREAARLRAEFRQLARLEARYRVNGLSRWERADLDRRFDVLERQIRLERRDGQYGWRR